MGKLRDIYTDYAYVGKCAAHIQRTKEMTGKGPARYIADLSGATFIKEKVFPADIMVDLDTGDFFAISENLPVAAPEALTESAPSVGHPAGETLLGRFNVWEYCSPEERAAIGNGKSPENTVCFIAAEQGFSKSGLALARQTLGGAKVDGIVSQIERGIYFSDKYAPPLLREMTGKPPGHQGDARS